MKCFKTKINIKLRTPLFTHINKVQLPLYFCRIAQQVLMIHLRCLPDRFRIRIDQDFITHEFIKTSLWTLLTYFQIPSDIDKDRYIFRKRLSVLLYHHSSFISNIIFKKLPQIFTLHLKIFVSFLLGEKIQTCIKMDFKTS